MSMNYERTYTKDSFLICEICEICGSGKACGKNSLADIHKTPLKIKIKQSINYVNIVADTIHDRDMPFNVYAPYILSLFGYRQLD